MGNLDDDDDDENLFVEPWWYHRDKNSKCLSIRTIEFMEIIF